MVFKLLSPIEFEIVERKGRRMVKRKKKKMVFKQEKKWSFNHFVHISMLGNSCTYIDS
jgi:hypothetical protein